MSSISLAHTDKRVNAVRAIRRRPQTSAAIVALTLLGMENSFDDPASFADILYTARRFLKSKLLKLDLKNRDRQKALLTLVSCGLSLSTKRKSKSASRKG